MIIVDWVELGDQNDCYLTVCLRPRRGQCDERAQFFAAKVDTGHGGNFSITASQLEIAGLSIDQFKICGHTIVHSVEGTQKKNLYQGALWINTPTGPFRVSMSDGFIFYEDRGPRTPLIGTRVMAAARIQLLVDYPNRRYTIHRQPFLRFAKWLVVRQFVSAEQRLQALSIQAGRKVPADRLKTFRNYGLLAGIFQSGCPITALNRPIAEFAGETNLIMKEDETAWGQFAQSNEVPIGTILVQIGALSQTQLDHALEIYQEAKNRFYEQ